MSWAEGFEEDGYENDGFENRGFMVFAEIK